MPSSTVTKLNLTTYNAKKMKFLQKTFIFRYVHINDTLMWNSLSIYLVYNKKNM